MEQGQSVADFRQSTNYGSQVGENQGQITNIFQQHAEDPQIALHRALYFKEMNDRVHQIYDADAETFQWVWSTSFATWLNSDKAQTFWISGKPGSGKSTLMKHLASAEKLLQYLPEGKKWIRIHFYFDFRAVDGIANSSLGMLKAFAWQFSESLPKDENPMIDKAVNGLLQNMESKDLTNEICKTIKSTGISILAFIDGLDEFSGDHAELARSLLRLTHHSSIKMCLASRPEIAFRSRFKKLPTFNMQEHNEQTIRTYIESAIDCKRHRLKTPFSNALVNNLVRRAQGVVLWARFAIDELLNRSEQGDSQEKLREILDTLPVEVGQMYQIILDRLEPGYRAEAAFILSLVLDAGGSIPLEQILEAWVFHYADSPTYMNVVRYIDLPGFEIRILGFFGSLLDIQGEQPGASVKIVRTIHQTLQSYLSESKWLSQNLPELFKQRFSGAPWLHTYAMAIHTASKEATLNRREIRKELQTQNFNEPNIEDFVELQGWQPWRPILSSALKMFFHYARRREYRDTPYYKTLRMVLETDIMIYNVQVPIADETRKLFMFLSEPNEHCCTDSTDVLEPSIIDLAIATAYGLSGYVEYRISQDTSGVKRNAQFILDLALYCMARLSPTLIRRQNTDPNSLWSSHGEIAGMAVALGAAVFRENVHDIMANGSLNLHYLISLLRSLRTDPFRENLSGVRVGGYGLLHGWSHIEWAWVIDPHNVCSELLAFLIDMGEPLNGFCYGGGTVLHAILEEPPEVDLPSERFRPMLFDVAIKAGADHTIRGSRGNVLAFAESMRDRFVTRLNPSSVSFDPESSEEIESQLSSIHTIIDLLEHYERYGNWDALDSYYQKMEDDGYF